jgi:hypothetical protein
MLMLEMVFEASIISVRRYETIHYSFWPWQDTQRMVSFRGAEDQNLPLHVDARKVVHGLCLWGPPARNVFAYP